MIGKRVKKRKCRKCQKMYPAAHFQDRKVTHLYCNLCRDHSWK